MKHHVGDKFVIEIGETFYSDNDCKKLYSIKGFNALIFDENGLDRLEKLEGNKEEVVDWSKVAVDTPILVSNNGKYWYRRYFAKYKTNRRVYKNSCKSARKRNPNKNGQNL